MAENVVRVSGLTKTFGKNTVLSNVNISLERGKIYGFIGQNGAGKTTLINHINGLLFPDEGEIELFGASDSKVHVIIYQREDGCYLKDNKATNGTYLNGARLDENAEQKLSNDAMISIGGEDFIFKLS